MSTMNTRDTIKTMSTRNTRDTCSTKLHVIVKLVVKVTTCHNYTTDTLFGGKQTVLDIVSNMVVVRPG